MAAMMASTVAPAAAAATLRSPQPTMVRNLRLVSCGGSYHGLARSSRKTKTLVVNVGVDPTAAMEGSSNQWDGTTETAQAEWSESQTTSQVQAQADRNYQQEQEDAWSEPPRYSRPASYDNCGRLLNFIAGGRAMQLALNSQKEFDMFLDKCGAFGVILPEDASDIKRNLSELDPKQIWIVVDSRAVMKFAKKLALEEADKKGNEYPPGFVENMLNRDKYGRYDSDDDD